MLSAESALPYWFTVCVSAVGTWVIFRLVPVILGRSIVAKRYNSLPIGEQRKVQKCTASLCAALVEGTISGYIFLFRSDIGPDLVRYDCSLLRHNVAIFLGYTIADTLLLLLTPEFTGVNDLLLHHAASLYSGYAGLTYPVLPYYINLYLLMEISNPMLNMRVILDVMGYKRSDLYMINSVVWTVAFFLVRILTIPLFWYNVAVYASRALFQQGVAIILTGLVLMPIFNAMNVFWFVKILLGARAIIKDRQQ
ncbi:TLC domain-containing protein 4-like [Branchiostoma floridae]|uniref:TLC domain-containing protein 4-like n=1 Tax=Branchiostoma floridae TaxID=7739 RepID=A0A9J7N7K3_BRAFL|nr:TLC domain-containing protein 4-like [Branchiostoma floridae]